MAWNNKLVRTVSPRKFTVLCLRYNFCGFICLCLILKKECWKRDVNKQSKIRSFNYHVHSIMNVTSVNIKANIVPFRLT